MIESITSQAGFQRLKAEWRELLRHSASESLFTTWEWLFTWWTHLSAGRRLMILVVRREGGIEAIAPFAIRPVSVSRLLPFRAIELLGSGSVGSDYLDLIVKRGAEAETIDEIATHLESLRLPLELPQVLLEGSSLSLLGDRMALRGWRVSITPTNVCPFISLDGLGWPSYLASLGASHRANFRRRSRGLERIDKMRFEPVRSEEDRRMALGRLVLLHNARWKGRGGSDAFNTRNMILFHEEFSALALRNGWLRLMILRVGPDPVAYFYGFRHRAVYSFYQSAFDPAWNDRSVGLVAMGLAIRSAIEEGAGEFDLLHGAERYKYHWAHKERAIGRMELHSPHLRGWITSGTVELGRVVRGMGRSLLGAQGGGTLA